MLLLLLLAAAPAWGSSVIPLTPEQLATQASVIVEGRVERVASGLDAEAGRLATYVTVQVERVHRGQDVPAEIVLREAGGRFGDLLHVVDAAPRYAAGEQVLLFLEPAADGALRTAGMFLGKFDLVERGRVRIAERETAQRSRERFRPADLRATAAAVEPAAERPWLSRPAELPTLRWDGPGVTWSAAAGQGSVLQRTATADPLRSRFVAADLDAPARWTQSDSGVAVTMDMVPSKDPLGSELATVAQVARAMEAWSDAPEARVRLMPGDTDSTWVKDHDTSPAAGYSGAANIILFNDPYDDIPDPVGCSGVLAIGGYWGLASSFGGHVNNVRYHASSQAYVIFNNDFECFLGEPENLAEVATHELGHVLGLGHSTVADSVMRAWPYGLRGANLGEDDLDAAHCIYPHAFALTEPAGGESYDPGEVVTVRWQSSEESGPDAGLLDVELSIDNGKSWTTLAAGVANDGAHSVVLPDARTRRARVRLARYNRMPMPSGAPYPDACSGARMAEPFLIGVTRGPFADRSTVETNKPRPWLRPFRY